MKHLMIYEAFKSDIITKLNKFLGKKIGKSESNNFIETLKHYLMLFNFPPNEIKDEDLKYLPSKKAIRIKAPDGWTPSSNDIDYDIYAFKFWFSLEKGFLGTTGIGSKTCYSENSNEPFDKNDLNYIKDNLGITKGELYPVEDYSELKHGQEVIGYFDRDSIPEKLAKAKIYISKYGQIYAIQNVSDGLKPDGYSSTEWGDYSWTLVGINGAIGYDHHKLHIYNETEEELHLKVNDNEEKDPLRWNIIVRKNYPRLINCEQNILLDRNFIMKSDFCIVFYIDNLIKRGYKKASEYGNEREENRKEATALYTDNQIRSMNIKKYMSEIIDRMGIKVGSEVKDLKNLERVLKMSICGRFPLYSLSKSLYYLKEFILHLSNMVQYKDINSFNKLRDDFIKYNTFSKKATSVYNKSEEIIMNSSNTLLIDVFNSIKEINDDITDYINKQEINTLSDLGFIISKLIFIDKISTIDKEYYLNVYPLITRMNDVGNVKYYSYSYFTDEQLVEDLKKLKDIKKLVRHKLTLQKNN